MFRKKKITPEEISGALNDFVMMNEIIYKKINDISSNPHIIEKIALEVLSLNLFSMDYSLYLAIGNTTEKAAIMNHLVLNILLQVPNGTPSDFIDFANKRQIEYSRALKNANRQDEPNIIGKTFCQFINKKQNADLICLGNAIFSDMRLAIAQLMLEILKDYKITPR